jgi:galactose mutarotase-like enzyme
MTTALETVTIDDGHARAHFAPGRGGILTRLSVEGRALLYLDESTLLDPSKSVRGGNPVLFPSPGPLAEGRFEWRGKRGAMKQHGVARSMAWSVDAASREAVTLRAAAAAPATDDDTARAEFPWRFVLTFRYALAGGRLRIDQRIENAGDAPMPFAVGFHPYFAVRDADKPKTRIPTTATRAWDNVAKTEIALAAASAALDLAKPEVDLHLVDHGRADAALELADGQRIVVRGSPEYRRWVVWTLAGKDFVCLEPWTAAANALNTGESLLVVEPGAARELFVEIALETRG